MPDQIMLVNSSADDECRIAVVEDGKLEELYSERTSSQSHVGNVYLGRVTNVEPAIQAAFVDFGTGRNGFLHISDLHPMYFPGETKDTTERVGKKTPRRERPPIQAALKRGQEILVQVLKDGIGTKGPTLTSYISIPGRFLVMMPFMERLGVSRRVEDEDQRRELRSALDGLDLPDGFGFIMRTAGLGQTKTELKRDLAFLQRLWKDMQRRKNRSGGKPQELYAESDLLIRTIRDVVSKDINRIVVDDISALKRIDRFLAVVAPRSGPELVYYDRETPLFHAFGVEQQITEIRSPVAPLPSGGYLVIEQTEALVAIDVNSGKSRDSRDAETNAYRTNQEAVKEIARQLRLRDLGGLVINDLIDMNQRKHQQAIENAFRDHLKKDRARTKILRTSQFGIIEMTRQRMRGGIQSSQHKVCPHCDGAGHIKSPETVALDMMRNVAALLDLKIVQQVEVSVARLVASEILSKQRYRLCLLEQRTGKKVHVRVSEDIAPDRVDYYAYDDRGSDINLEHLPHPQPPEDLPVLRRGEIEELEEGQEQLLEDEHAQAKSQFLEEVKTAHGAQAAPQGDEEGQGKKRKRRRRRKRKKGTAAEQSGEQTPEQPQETTGEDSPQQSAEFPAEADSQEDEDDERPKKRRRRRGRRGGRKNRKPEPGTSRDKAPQPQAADAPESAEDLADEVTAPEAAPVDEAKEMAAAEHGQPADGADAPDAAAEAEEPKKRKSRRRKKTTKKAAEAEDEAPAAAAQVETKPEKKSQADAPDEAETEPPAEKKTKRKTRRKKKTKAAAESNEGAAAAATKKAEDKPAEATPPAGKTTTSAPAAADGSVQKLTPAGSKKLPKRKSIRATTRRTKKPIGTPPTDVGVE